MAGKLSSTQSTDISYSLHSLGWKAFQDLCAAIVSEVLGQTVQIFLPTRDAGRDGAFHGTWTPHANETYSGSFTVQCKFSAKQDTSLKLGKLSDELAKAEKLASKGLAANYILMTNIKVSATAEAEIRSAFQKIKHLNHFLLFGQDWITQKIRESSRLRMLVPRVYGLGDLSQILDERAYAQAQEILSVMGDDLAKFVITDAHRKSARAIVEHGFVLLLGEPASGKSTIAASLAIGAIDIWKCSAIKIRNANEFVAHWNPNEPAQFFWVDDAFGATQYQRDYVDEWNSVFAHMTAAVKKGARVLFTSRNYIYKAARSDLKTTAFPLLENSQVIINVHQLSKNEKQQILYNHIKLGDQRTKFRSEIKPYLPSVASNEKFLPEIARRLGNRLFTKNLDIVPTQIQRFVDEPLSFLIDVVRNLDRDSHAALATVFINGGLLESPVTLGLDEEHAIARLGSSAPAMLKGLTNLDKSLLKLIKIKGRYTWAFKHPTIGDAFAQIISEDPELLDIYLAGTKTEKLISEVVCGKIRIEGARVIIPANRYNVIIQKLGQLPKNRGLYTFLGYRCNRSFIKQYVRQHPGIFKDIIQLGSYISAKPEITLLAKLHRYGLLPEAWRIKFVKNVEMVAIETPDADFLRIKHVREIIQPSEISRILGRVRNELIPKLDEVIDTWQDDYDSSDDPESHFDLLVEALKIYDEEINDPNVTDAIDRALNHVDDVVEELRSEVYQGEPDYDYSDLELGDGHADTERDIFDDVDK